MLRFAFDFYQAEFMRAYGATESLPPDDADLIVDNTATGATLKANGLEIIETLMTSTTRLFASKRVLCARHSSMHYLSL